MERGLIWSVDSHKIGDGAQEIPLFCIYCLFSQRNTNRIWALCILDKRYYLLIISRSIARRLMWGIGIGWWVVVLLRWKFKHSRPRTQRAANVLFWGDRADCCRMFFQTLSDLTLLPVKLSTPITFIPQGPILSVSFSNDRRFISIVRSPTLVEIYNLVDPK